MSGPRVSWLTTSADANRVIPRSAEERGWEIDAALESLDAEQRRLERMGFELPLARCHEQRRFWEFVRALHALEPSPTRRAA